MGVTGSEDGMVIIPSSSVERPSLMVSSKHVVVHITACPLKQIDPALRSGKKAKGETNEIVAVKLHCDQLVVFEVPSEDTQFDEGGEVPNFS